jgi:hypothetical protein
MARRVGALFDTMKNLFDTSENIDSYVNSKLASVKCAFV